MEGQRLILKDGTELENCSAGYADGYLWCYLIGLTLQEAAALFFDPAKTDKIIYQFGDMSAEYDGFTVCKSISDNGGGHVSVCMVRGAA